MSGWMDPHTYVRADRIEPRRDLLSGREVLSVTISRDSVVVALGRRIDRPYDGDDLELALATVTQAHFNRDKRVGVIRRRWRPIRGSRRNRKVQK